MFKFSVKISFGLMLLTQVQASNLPLLVGTTGDYPPLTYATESGLTGKDIRIIRDFAAAKHYDLHFVITTWPNLSADLRAAKFNLAVGGISANALRAQEFIFSQAIESSAKVPLIRCRDSLRFTSFAAIDNESVMVVENRGGTNQDFALKNIQHAPVLLFPKNFAALASIEKHQTDVMFTDDVEVTYRQQLNPELCQADIPEKFPSSPKVFMFSKTLTGQKLQQEFNSWWLSVKARY